jgi:hypothetical protein
MNTVLSTMFSNAGLPSQLDLAQAIYSKPRAKTNEELEQSWKDGKDFQILLNGPYCSIRDTAALKAKGVEAVMLWLGNRQGVEVKL